MYHPSSSAVLTPVEWEEKPPNPWYVMGKKSPQHQSKAKHHCLSPQKTKSERPEIKTRNYCLSPQLNQMCEPPGTKRECITREYLLESICLSPPENHKTDKCASPQKPQPRKHCPLTTRKNEYRIEASHLVHMLLWSSESASRDLTRHKLLWNSISRICLNHFNLVN